MNASSYYILDAAGEPVPEPDVLTWARWFQTAERHVANEVRGDVQVSTVFLGLNHNYNDLGAPILWETMVFGGPHDGYQDRYTSRADALDGHEWACALAFGGDDA